MRKRKGLLSIAAIILLIAVIGSIAASVMNVPVPGEAMETFDSCDQMINTFAEARQEQQKYSDYMLRGVPGGALQTLAMAEDTAAAPTAAAQEYSETTVQVEGVDEADIVKTDGTYIYTITQGEWYYGRWEVVDEGSSNEPRLIIAKAYPAEEAEILSETPLGKFSPTEMFIDGDRLLLFGTTYEEIDVETPEPVPAGDPVTEMMIAPYPYPQRIFLTTIQVWDISDREEPEIIRTVDFEGTYLTSRKIGHDVYFVVNSYPEYTILERMATPADKAKEILPVYRDSEEGEDYKPSCGCADVGYSETILPERFITLASISMADDDAEVEREVILGSGQNVYASLENLYVAETSWPYWGWIMPLARGTGTASVESVEEITEKTVIHKFALDGGKISYQSDGEVRGYILNQFSMDEHEGYFRIATTVGRVSRSGDSLSSNNIYVLNSDMEQVGEIEDIAPGEQIYSARFIGDRGYLVTFKKIDPFFVIDLSDPEDPEILGKLKIPGYSDYLHPYDENHIIGIGKDTEEAEESAGNFAWYQGLKMAVFDVTDVENPTEMHRIIIGDRGTDSYALHDHKAFLFDRERNLLVIPVLLAEITGDKEDLPRWTHGDYVYQGAYV
ncbi:MAG: beta-propeller domain-containing protein, partial [Candidatus Aenigmatarchaeota archaeon]